VPLDGETVNTSLIDHIIKNSDKLAEGKDILEKARKEGIELVLSDKQIEAIGNKVLERYDDISTEGPLYLKSIIGAQALPLALQERIGDISIRELTRGNLRKYDDLQSLLTAKRMLTQALRLSTFRQTHVFPATFRRSVHQRGTLVPRTDPSVHFASRTSSIQKTRFF